MTFDECISSIHKGTVLTFKEYTIDRHEKKRLSLEVEDTIVQSVFQANVTLNRETLVEYYGEDLEDIEYMQLSCMNCPRLVLGLGMNEDGELDVKIVTVVKDFYELGLQEIEVKGNIDEGNLQEPNYFLAQRGW